MQARRAAARLANSEAAAVQKAKRAAEAAEAAAAQQAQMTVIRAERAASRPVAAAPPTVAPVSWRGSAVPVVRVALRPAGGVGGSVAEVRPEETRPPPSTASMGMAEQMEAARRERAAAVKGQQEAAAVKAAGGRGTVSGMDPAVAKMFGGSAGIFRLPQ